MRFFLKNDEVSNALRFRAFELESLLSVPSLVVERLRFGFNLTDGGRVSIVDRLPLIIEIEDELYSSVFWRLNRGTFGASVIVCKEYRLDAESLLVDAASATSRVECRRENNSKLLSTLLLSIFDVVQHSVGKTATDFLKLYSLSNWNFVHLMYSITNALGCVSR